MLVATALRRSAASFVPSSTKLNTPHTTPTTFSAHPHNTRAIRYPDEDSSFRDATPVSSRPCVLRWRPSRPRRAPSLVETTPITPTTNNGNAIMMLRTSLGVAKLLMRGQACLAVILSLHHRLLRCPAALVRRLSDRSQSPAVRRKQSATLVAYTGEPFGKGVKIPY